MAPRFIYQLLSSVLTLAMMVPPTVAGANELGVSVDTILIGRVTPSSSPVFGDIAKQRTGSADAYIASVNAAGGIHGRKLVIKDRDDAYKADQATAEVKALINDDKVFALMGSFGTHTLPVIMKEAEAAMVPLVGATMLSNKARDPVQRYVFPVRISLSDETSTVVKHQTTIGVRKFVVLASEEAYGPDGQAAYVEALKRFNVQPAAVITFSVGDDPAEVARRIHAADPKALLVSVLPKAFAKVLKQYRALGGSVQVHGFSAIRIEDLRAALGDMASGIVLSQGVPSPARRSVPLVAEYRKVLQHFAPGTEPSYHGLDAFLEAKVLVDGLRKAGRSLTREKLLRALESMKNRDFGGVNVRYGPGDRTGSTYVDLVLLGSQNKVVN